MPTVRVFLEKGRLLLFRILMKVKKETAPCIRLQNFAYLLEAAAARAVIREQTNARPSSCRRVLGIVV